MEWIPITGEGFITESAIVTQLINNRSQSHVTIGLPGWGHHNDTIAYMPLPRPIHLDRRGWESEYMGDELPQMKGEYIVQIQGATKERQGITHIIEAYFEMEKERWMRIPNGFEVIAWRRFPKPFIPRTK